MLCLFHSLSDRLGLEAAYSYVLNILHCCFFAVHLSDRFEVWIGHWPKAFMFRTITHIYMFQLLGHVCSDTKHSLEYLKYLKHACWIRLQVQTKNARINNEEHA